MKITPTELAERVEHWGATLGLLGIGHFSIDCVSVVDETPGGPSAKATVQVSTDYDHAHFWFQRDFIKKCNADELDQTIIHEWVHVAMRDLDQLLTGIQRWMPEATFEEFEERLEHEREGVVDRVAHALFEAHSGHRARFHY